MTTRPARSRRTTGGSNGCVQAAAVVTAARSAAPGTERRAWLAWVPSCLIWGTTYLGIKVALETYSAVPDGRDPLHDRRTILAAAARQRRHPLPARSNWGPAGRDRVLHDPVGNTGVVWGEQFVPSG
jgi:hypothetical protein